MMNKIVERRVRDPKDAQPVTNPLVQEENLQSLFLDPDLSDLESGARLRGAILEYSGREISGWIVDARSPAASVALSLLSVLIQSKRRERAARLPLGLVHARQSAVPASVSIWRSREPVGAWRGLLESRWRMAVSHRSIFA